jgi:hypothetical protein
MLPHTEGTVINQSLKIEIVEGYIERRIGNLMNLTINRGSSGRVHVDID